MGRRELTGRQSDLEKILPDNWEKKTLAPQIFLAKSPEEPSEGETRRFADTCLRGFQEYALFVPL